MDFLLDLGNLLVLLLLLFLLDNLLLLLALLLHLHPRLLVLVLDLQLLEFGDDLLLVRVGLLEIVHEVIEI
jgi:hypothetical protein